MMWDIDDECGYLVSRESDAFLMFQRLNTTTSANCSFYSRLEGHVFKAVSDSTL
jgi:hypothetical protein